MRPQNICRLRKDIGRVGDLVKMLAEERAQKPILSDHPATVECYYEPGSQAFSRSVSSTCINRLHALRNASSYAPSELTRRSKRLTISSTVRDMLDPGRTKARRDESRRRALC